MAASPEERAARYDPHPDYATMTERDHAVAGVSLQGRFVAAFPSMRSDRDVCMLAVDSAVSLTPRRWVGRCGVKVCDFKRYLKYFSRSATLTRFCTAQK